MQRTAFVFFLLITSCNREEAGNDKKVRPADSVNIEEVVVRLPEGEGKELVEMSCVPCHSLRYIEMQPDMPKKTWEKIVSKMIKSYGAPVRDSATQRKIVDYLAAVKGATDKQPP